jgi:hypothetical protein
MKLNSSTGSYSPSFFVVRIDEPFVSSEVGFAGDGNLVLAHELVHFMQDMTTMIGVQNTVLMTDQIAWMRHKYGVNDGMPSVTVRRPVRPAETTDTSSRLLDVYWGSTEYDEVWHALDNVWIERIEVDGYPVNVVRIKSNESVVSRVVGGFYLLESMADAAERVLGSSRRTHAFPYHVDELILGYYEYDDVPPIVRLLLLEHVLQTVENAGLYYYWMIKDARKQEVNLMSFDSACRFLETVRIVTADRGDVVDPAARYSDKETALENLRVVLDAGVKYANTRLVELIRQTLEHKSGRYPITAEVVSHENDAWSFCQYIMSEFVGPLVVDYNNDVIEVDVGGDEAVPHEPMIFPALQTLHRVLFSDSEVKCELTDVCYKNMPHLPNEHCTTRPWKRPRNGQLCFYDRMQMGMGLHNVTFDPE